MPFSVLISVYRNDKPSDFRTAVESISVMQTLPPDEIVLVIDGPVPEPLSQMIKSLEKEIPALRPIWLKENSGLGNALRIGLEACSNEIVARMDADDISAPDRFEKQISYLDIHPEISVLGGQITEFIGQPDNIIGCRSVPLSPEKCRKYYQDRDPLNHMTVMLRKSEILSVGGYLPWHLDEDTYLWGRTLKGGYNLANLSETLVNVRVGKEMYARRGGWKYFKSDSKIIKWKLKNGLTPKSRFLYHYSVRFIIQVLMPNSFRGFIFKNLLRTR